MCKLLSAMSLALATILVAAGASNAASIGTCKFDSGALKFKGDAQQQAACLLRKVREKGSGADAQPIPDWLQQRLHKPVGLSVAKVRAYLDAQGINDDDIGGPIADGDAADRRYFVIHDTSAPELTGVMTFPGNINDQSYSGNTLSGWGSLDGRVNLIISRDGRSRTIVDWKTARTLPATKLERGSVLPASRKVFVHVENIQPRIKPAGSWAWKAPVPGFGPKQERRLAVAYVVASVRSGRWLIPAYHFNIDEGLPDGHDDPQHADLPAWVEQVAAVEQDISATMP